MQPPTPPEQPYNYGPPQPQRKRHRLRYWLLGVGGLLVLVIVVAALASGGNGKTAGGATSTSARFTPSEPYGPIDQASSSVYSPPTPKYLTPTNRDFKITLKVLSKDCFGDAGCVINYEPKLEQLSLGDFDPSVTYDVTYEVRGGSDGAQVDTLQVTGDKYNSNEGTAQTSSSGAQLKAVITSVEAE